MECIVLPLIIDDIVISIGSIDRCVVVVYEGDEETRARERESSFTYVKTTK